MSTEPVHILLVEDSSSDAALLQEALNEGKRGRFQFTHVHTLTDGLVRLGEQRFDVLLLDSSLPDTPGRKAFRRARAAAPELPIMMLADKVDEVLGLEAVRPGVQDYLLKSKADGIRTARAIRHVIERQRADAELRRARNDLEQRVAERTSALKHTVEVLRQEIKQRQLAQQALRESEERYRTLFESAPVGIAVSTYQGKIIAFNRHLCAMAGVTPEEARALRATDFHVLTGQRRHLLAQVRKQGKVEQCEILLKRKDGSTLLGLVYMEEVRLGQQKALLTIVEDITRQKQDEWRAEGVRELLELFLAKPSLQAYADAAVRVLSEWSGCRCAGIRVMDRDGRIPYAARVGYSRAFLKLENCLSLDTADCPCSRIFRGRSLARDAQFMSPKGSFFCNRAGESARQFCAAPAQQSQVACLQAGYNSLAHVPIRYRGRLFGTIHLADRRSDRFPAETVTFIETVAPLIGEAIHRFQVEASLVESERRFRSMFEHHDAPMLVVDPEPGTIEDANPAAAAFYGSSRERLRTMRIEDLCAVPPQTAESLRERARRQTPRFLTFPHRLASGEIRTVEIQSSPLELNDRRLLFSIIQDVTERKRLERQILDIGELERERIGRDLHDSLGGMLSGTALLTKALAHRLKDNGSADAAAAEEAVRAINETIGQIRSMARGLFPPELSATGLPASLRGLAAETTKRSGISCRVRADRRLAIADPSVVMHLFRIAQEAVNNAIRHGQPRQITVRLVQRRHRLVLEVRDDGKGLPAHRPSGKGLGLRTMKHRAGLIGARFTVESAEGRGTVVSCRLPVTNGSLPKPA